MFSNLHTVDKLADDIKCKTCLSVAYKGSVSVCCEQLWCAACKSYYSNCDKCEKALKFTFPPLPVNQKLQQTKVRCIFFSRGCDETVPLKDLESHTNQCEWKKAPSRYIVGIDLGTTISSVGVFINSKLVTIKNQLNETQVPSAVYFEKSTNKVHVGREAIARGAEDPNGLVFGAKRLIGEQFSKASIPKEWPFKVVQHEQDKCMIQTRSRKVSPEEISSYVLKNLKETAERYLSQEEPYLDPVEVRRAVITVPAHFSDSQRRATMNAAQMAGLEVEMLLNEPTAAAICYYASQGKKNFKKSQKCVVFDLGGGTLDITLVKIKKEEVTVLGIVGDSHLGGHDFDCRIAKLLREKVESEGLICSIETAMLHAEQIKKVLSANPEVQIPLSKIDPKCKNLVTITRKEFELESKDLLERSIQLAKDLLQKVEIPLQDVQDVILAGGSTHVPKISEMLENVFGKKPLKNIDPSEAIVVGATITGALRNPLYVESDSMIWEYMVINDVCSHSLGVAVHSPQDGYPYTSPGGSHAICKMSTLIGQFTLIPHETSGTYFSAEGSTRAAITVLEGEDPDPNKNHFLGYFAVNTSEEKKEIEVTFKYDYSGMLTVTASSAIDKQNIQVSLTSNQTKSSTELSNIKAFKDNQIQVSPVENPSIVVVDNGIKELEVTIIGEAVHLRWEIKDSLKNDMKSFIVSINDQEQVVPVSKIDNVKMEYMMPLPDNQKTQQTFNCKVRCISKSGVDLSWSPLVVAEYIPLAVLQKKHELKLITNANKMLQVFGCAYGQNKAFWATVRRFSKVLVKIRASYTKSEEKKKPMGG